VHAYLRVITNGFLSDFQDARISTASSLEMASLLSTLARIRRRKLQGNADVAERAALKMQKFQHPSPRAVESRIETRKI